MSTARTRRVLAFVVFAVLFGQVLLYPGIDTLVAAFGAEMRLDASMWFLAAEFAAFVVCAGVWGAVSDITGKRVPFIVVSAVGGSVSYTALATLPTTFDLPFTAVLLLRVLQGGVTIGAFSLAMTMLMDLEGGHGRNMGAAGIAIGAGTALGAPLGGQLYELGPLLPLYTASVLLLGVAVLVSRVRDRTPASNRGNLTDVLRSASDNPVLGLPYVFGFIDRFTAGFFALVGTLYFRTIFELSPGATGLMLGLFFAPFALLQYPFGILSDRIGRTAPIVIGSSLYGIGVMFVGQAPTVELAGILMVAVGVLGALMAPATMALVTDLAPSTERGIAMAGFNIAGSMGFLTGIIVGGSVVEVFGYRPAFLVAGGIEVLLALGTLPVFLRLPTRHTA